MYTETGHGKKKKEAKREAASRVLDKLRAAGERNEGLGRLTPEVVKKCHEMLSNFILFLIYIGVHAKFVFFFFRLKKCVLTEPKSAESVTARVTQSKKKNSLKISLF